MKILEDITDAITSQQVDNDSMQFGFMPGLSTIDAIFILKQMQERRHLKRKTMYVDLEKIFDRGPCGLFVQLNQCTVMLSPAYT